MPKAIKLLKFLKKTSTGSIKDNNPVSSRKSLNLLLVYFMSKIIKPNKYIIISFLKILIMKPSQVSFTTIISPH
jgi:hypothetical protein